MGYTVHHTIIVTTTWDEQKIKTAHKKAVQIFGKLVSEIVKTNCNGYNSFFVAPDGSKDGWEISNTGDSNREKFIGWLNSQRYSDFSRNREDDIVL